LRSIPQALSPHCSVKSGCVKDPARGLLISFYARAARCSAYGSPDIPAGETAAVTVLHHAKEPAMTKLMTTLTACLIVMTTTAHAEPNYRSGGTAS